MIVKNFHIQFQMQHSNTGGGFFSKIKENYSSKFANLSLAGGNIEKDGATEDDTLIHRSFVKYYESKGLAYPEWLGVKTFELQNHNQPTQYGRSLNYNSKLAANSNGPQNGRTHAYRNHSAQSYADSEFQPVRQDNLFNNSYSQRSLNLLLQLQHGLGQAQSTQPQSDLSRGSSRSSAPSVQRSSSRLQDMYNKSRQQSATSGYSSARYSR